MLLITVRFTFFERDLLLKIDFGSLDGLILDPLSKDERSEFLISQNQLLLLKAKLEAIVLLRLVFILRHL